MDLQVFNNNQFGELRTVVKDGEPWFVAVDVCKALEIANPTQAVNRLDSDERAMFNIGRQGETNIISESGLYSLVLGSRKPQANAFKRWVTHDVIPSIRKHGAYMTPSTIEKVLSDPDTIIRLATDLKKEREQRKQLERKVEQDKPKVLFADAVETAKTSILVGELAKLLRQNGIKIGQNRLFEWLRQNGYLIARAGHDHNMPTQYSMERGLMEIKERTINNPDGSTYITRTPKITGKGQRYFINKFLGGESRDAG